MTHCLTPRTRYSRAETLSDAAVHVAGLAIVALAAPGLVALTLVTRGADLPALLGASVYSVTLVATILCSALCQMGAQHRLAGLFRRLDHAAIYWKIAGTYTPFTLLSGGQGSALLVGLWVAAGLGTLLRALGRDGAVWLALALALYLGMGWAGVFAGSALLATMSPAVLTLIFSGGALYTVGVAFFLLQRLPFHKTIWHALVLIASLLFYAAVALHVLGGWSG